MLVKINLKPSVLRVTEWGKSLKFQNEDTNLRWSLFLGLQHDKDQIAILLV